ncbi:MAG: DJ-1/PfpI family protein [Cyanobacteria bacterium J06597_1]
MNVDVLIFDGFDELDAIGPYEVLQNAKDFGADIAVRLVTLGNRTEVTASHGLCVKPHGVLETARALDLLVVPGGGWGNKADRGAWAEVQKGEILEAIALLHEKGTLVASVCTGAMLVAHAGLMKGRPAITHAVALADLQALGADVKEARVVDDGDIISAGGVTSGIDLALWLVERFFGAEMLAEVEVELEYQRQGMVWRHAET